MSDLGCPYLCAVSLPGDPLRRHIAARIKLYKSCEIAPPEPGGAQAANIIRDFCARKSRLLLAPSGSRRRDPYDAWPSETLVCGKCLSYCLRRLGPGGGDPHGARTSETLVCGKSLSSACARRVKEEETRRTRGPLKLLCAARSQLLLAPAGTRRMRSPSPALVLISAAA